MSPPEAAPDAEALSAQPQLLRERVLLLANQSAGAVGATFLGAVLIGFVLSPAVPAQLVALWLGAYLGPSTWRIVFSRQLLQGLRAPDESALRRYLFIAGFNGLWTGGLPLAFFSYLSPEGRAALTVVTLLAITAGASTFAAYRRGFLSMLVLALPPLILDWARLGGEGSWVVVVTLTVFGLLMVRVSGNMADLFERSVLIRLERERVVQQLRHEKEQTERARQAAEEASRAKSRFLANASHDLRQPAHALSLFTGVLEDTAQTQQHRDIARNIALASRMLGELLDNLLDISRLDAGTVSVALQPVALRPLVERLRADTQRMAEGRPIRITGEADDRVVLLDPLLVERALRNLLDNALKFTASGFVHLSAQAQDARLLLRVADSGCGIAAEQQPLVFEEFYQVGNPERDQRRGLGLGLSIVVRLATLMAGTVAVDSELSRGSSFTISLPLRPAGSDAQPEAALRVDRVDLRGWQVLVIDDAALVREGMGRLLASWGARVDEAEDLAQALALAAQPGQPPWNLCLCDLRLRGGEQGIASAGRLRARFPALPVMLITGDTAPQQIEAATRSGLPLLHKPVTPEELARAIHRIAFS